MGEDRRVHPGEGERGALRPQVARHWMRMSAPSVSVKWTASASITILIGVASSWASSWIRARKRSASAKNSGPSMRATRTPGVVLSPSDPCNGVIRTGVWVVAEPANRGAGGARDQQEQRQDHAVAGVPMVSTGLRYRESVSAVTWRDATASFKARKSRSFWSA